MGKKSLSGTDQKPFKSSGTVGAENKILQYGWWVISNHPVRLGVMVIRSQYYGSGRLQNLRNN